MQPRPCPALACYCRVDSYIHRRFAFHDIHPCPIHPDDDDDDDDDNNKQSTTTSTVTNDKQDCGRTCLSIMMMCSCGDVWMG
jgi:hypothetical protein